MNAKQNNGKGESTKHPVPKPVPLNQIQDWPERAKQAKWKAKTLAENCGVSERTLRRLFLKKMGDTLRKWLAEKRLRTGLDLLGNGFSVKETADFLGYKQQSSLTRYYKSKTGICPSKQPQKRTKPNNCPQMLNRHYRMSANDKYYPF